MEYLKKRKIENFNFFEEQKEVWIKEGNFDNFAISTNTKSNLIKHNFLYLFPIQQKTFNIIYNGYDVIGKDRTGSGKTLAYGWPIIEKLRQNNKFSVSNLKVLIWVPTRELCIQVTKELEKLINYENELKILSVYGGVSIDDQIYKLNKGVDIVVGTPGRVIDLQKRLILKSEFIESIILDETDQMLDIGFKTEIEFIINNIKWNSETNKQIILFSATVPKWVKETANKYLNKKYLYIDLVKNNEQKTSITVEHLALFCPSYEYKIQSISDILSVYGGSHSKTLIFTETKKETNELLLKGDLKLEANVLHGDIPQNQREITFQSFRDGKLKCLIATNVAARGLDIPQIDLIIQLSPPKDIESYIHRSGRTARAGKTGVCVTYYTNKQKEILEKIEKKANIKFKQIGFPQPIDIIKANFEDIILSFKSIPDDISNCFIDNVDSLIEEYGAKNALAKAMVLISGQKDKIVQRSLLCAKENYKTYILELFNNSYEKIGYFWGILKKRFSEELISSIKGMKFLKGKVGVIFDIENIYQNEIEEFLKNMSSRDRFKFFAPSELPDLEENNKFELDNRNKNNFYNKNNYGNNYGNNYNNGYNNYNNGYKNNYNNNFNNNFNNNNYKNYGNNFNGNNNNNYFKRNLYNNNDNTTNKFNNFNNNDYQNKFNNSITNQDNTNNFKTNSNFNNNNFSNNNFNNYNYNNIGNFKQNNFNNNNFNQNNNDFENKNNRRQLDKQYIKNKDDNFSDKRKIYIGNISSNVKDKDVVELFGTHNIKIVSCKLFQDKGFAICEVPKDKIEEALSLNGTQLMGKNLNIRFGKKN